MKEIEFYKTEFPKTFRDFVYLSRPFSKEEIELCDKEGLIHLCTTLKEKELEYYTKYFKLLNEIEEFIESINDLPSDTEKNRNLKLVFNNIAGEKLLENYERKT